MATQQQLRQEFNEQLAPRLAGQLGAAPAPSAMRSQRFAYFVDTDGRFVVVAGDQEADDVDKALAYGLSYRGKAPLVLVLPHDRAFPTLQRSAWLKSGFCPTLYLHDGSKATAVVVPDRAETIRRAGSVVGGKTPEGELRDATSPLHLGVHSGDVVELVEWATTEARLDPGHRRGERSWHYMGQRVLSIRVAGGKLEIRAGIHTGDLEPHPVSAGSGGLLDPETVDAIKAVVEAGVAERKFGRHRAADEHWLQAVIRRDPSLVGVEQPALREVPAWRPAARPAKPGEDGAWGRGFIDLLGVDGHGDLRIVETKLAKNQDELLIFQGLDYYIWAQAYQKILRTRLGAPKGSEFIVHYVIGAPLPADLKLSRFAAAQTVALDIPWRMQTITGWDHGCDEPGRPASELLAAGQLPG